MHPMIKLFFSCKGQVVLETAIASLLLTFTTMVVMTMFYLFYASFWIDHTLSETNICVAEGAYIQECKFTALNSLSKSLFLSSGSFILHIRKTDKEIHSQLNFNFLNHLENKGLSGLLKQKLTFHKILRI